MQARLKHNPAVLTPEEMPKRSFLRRFDNTSLISFLFLFGAASVAFLFFYKANLLPLIGGVSRLGSWDGAFYYFWLRSMMIDGDLDFANEVAACNIWDTELRNYIYALPRTSSGLIANKYTIGWALLSLPWFLLAHGLTIVCNFFGAGIAADGCGLQYQGAVVLGQAVYAFSGCYYCYRFCHKRFPNETALLFPLVWLSSLLPFYQTAELFMVHNSTYFCLSVLFCLSDNEKMLSRPSGKALAGLLSGLLILCRPQAAVYLLFPSYALFRSIRRRSRVTQITEILFFAVPALLVIALQCLAWQEVYGSYLVFTYEGEYFNWLSPALVKVLWSEFLGLFYWHPIYLLGGLALTLWFVQTRSALPLLLSMSVLLNWYINAAWHNWWFGMSFGSRAFECATFAAILAVLWLYHSARAQAARALLIAVICLFAAWNTLLTASAIKGALPLDRPLSAVGMLQAVQKTVYPIFTST